MGRMPKVVDLLELEPVRCVPWRENVEGNVIIDRPRPSLRGLRGLIEGANWLISPHRIRLDRLGSFAWRRLDGVTKVRTLADVMREAFPDSRHQIEDRLGLYLKAMQKLGVIDFPKVEEPR